MPSGTREQALKNRKQVYDTFNTTGISNKKVLTSQYNTFYTTSAKFPNKVPDKELFTTVYEDKFGTFLSVKVRYNTQHQSCLIQRGCSASVSKAAFFNRHSFDYNVFHETTTSLKFAGREENNNLIVSDGNSDTSDSITRNTKTEGLQVNQAHILIFTRESSISSTGSSDYVPYNVVRQRSGSVTSGSRMWTPKRDSLTGIEYGNENRVIKSVLKTGPTATNGHLLTDRPIKSVTFLDAVTVVTVY